MARATFVKKARKNIYTTGKEVKYQGRAGSKREGRTMTKLDRTVPANKSDTIFIKRGESYYWWQFIRGPIHYSKVRPKRSQLTQSEFLGWLYDFEDDTIGTFSVNDEELENYSPDDMKSVRDEWVSEIEEKRDEQQERLDNMPKGLQDSSSSGQLLSERVEGLESWASDLEGVDLDWDDKELKTEADDEWDRDHTQALREDDPDVEEGKEEWLMKRFLELKRDKIEELIAELQAISSNL